MLETFELARLGHGSPAAQHLTIEVMRRAYRDRAAYLGDSDFVAIPDRLTEKAYARQLATEIDPAHATPSAELAGDVPLTEESHQTTHFSVIDGRGMAVANTYTLEYEFGSHVVVRGAGFLLNNEMSDFNPKPGVTNRRGLIGTPANVVAPRKRMLSSMTPTIIAKDGKPFLITGSPGSRTIINTVLNVTVNVIDFDMDVRAAVDAARLHHQWLPDEARLERLSTRPELASKLRAMGHTVVGNRQGDAHSILVDPKTGVYHAAEDHRIIGKASGF
jgi:gamma-glutamyltranspeptidase/glutathione hydrolase